MVRNLIFYGKIERDAKNVKKKKLQNETNYLIVYFEILTTKKLESFIIIIFKKEIEKM